MAIGFRNRLKAPKDKSRRAPGRRLFLEPLEDRRLLATGFAPGGAATLPIVMASPQGSASATGGYAPAQIRHAYGFDQIIGLPNGDYNNAGLGQTIAIIDWNNDPTITNDLKQFDEYLNIGGAANDPTSLAFFKVVNQDGGTTLPAVNVDVNEASEQALDVEWAHAIAPGANILLVEADSSDYSDTDTAVRFAATRPNVSVVSMSYGSKESGSELFEDNLFTTPTGHQGIVFVAATGDSGAPAGYPSWSTNVLAVGGTTLPQDASGNPERALESGWSDSGGGLSKTEPEPSYQLKAVPGALDPKSARATPDVAFNAGTGFEVYNSFVNPPGQPWDQILGTSAGTPQWAALIAIADQERVALGGTTLDGPSQLLPALYRIGNPTSADYDPAAFDDIKTGTSTGNPQYSADAGFDLVTGLGTPNAAALVSDLAEVDNAPPLPNTFYWTGAAGKDARGNYDWDDAGNWSTFDPAQGSVPPSDVLPGPADNVVIDLNNQNISHDEAAYDKIGSLTVTAAATGVTLNLVSGTLDLSGSGAAGVFNVPGNDTLGYGSVHLDGGTLAYANVSKKTIITVFGGTNFANGLGTIVGGTLNGTIEVAEAQDSQATLHLAGKWVNNGTITNVPMVNGKPFGDGGGAVYLGDTWDARQGDASAGSDAWVNNGTITTQKAAVYLGGWLTYDSSVKNLATLDLSTATVSLIGTLDNAPADNPNGTQGNLTLTPGTTSSSGAWNLSGGRIDGGTLTTSGDAVLTAANSSGALDGVTITIGSSVQASNGGLLVFEGLGWSNFGTIAATGPTDESPTDSPSTLNLYGSWTNEGAISVDSSSLSLGSPINIAPTAAAATKYTWQNPGTLALTGDGTTVNLGGVFTTATYNGIIDDLKQSNPDPTSVSFTLTGTLDNSEADNPANENVLALDDSTGSLSLEGGRIYQGLITTGGKNDLEAIPTGKDVPFSVSTLDGVTLDGTLNLASGSSVGIIDNLTLNGAIKLSGAVLYFGAQKDKHGQTVGGKGTIQLGTDPSGDTLFNVSACKLTIGPNITVQGGLNSVLNSPFGSVLNKGTIEETVSGGVFNVYGAPAVDVKGDVVYGIGIANYVAGTLSGGTWKVANGGSLGLSGVTIHTNAATIIVSGAASGIYADSGATNALSFLAANAAHGKLTVENGYTFNTPGSFSNAGAVLIGSTSLISTGTSGYTQTAGTTTVNGGLGAASVKLSGGSVTVAGGGSLSTGSGNYTQSKGTTTVAGGGFLNAASFLLSGGSLKGGGTVQADVANAATIVPQGTLTLLGDYTQSAAGLINLAIGGADPGQ